MIAVAVALVVTAGAPARAQTPPPTEMLQAFDPAYEVANFNKTNERFVGMTALPDYQLLLRVKGAEREAEALQIIATDGPAAQYGRVFEGQLCWQHMDGCAGDVRLYDWATNGFGTVQPILYTARNGSTISGHVWATRSGPAVRPGIVITNGSVQAPEELYWFAAQTLAKAGYVVMTWDPQGQGYSDTFGEGVDQQDGFPSQEGRPFYDGTEDALDFFFSTPSSLYRPRKSCTTGTDHTDKQAARVADGRNSAFNPFHALLDPTHVGVVGQSLGAGAVSYIGQIDPRVRAIVAMDNLGAPSSGPECTAAPQTRPANPPLTKPALGLTNDYSLFAPPFTQLPDPKGKQTASDKLSALGVDTGSLVVRGGTHFEGAFIPNPAFGSTLRGNDLYAWYLKAWFDRYVKEQPDADAPLLTDRWRHDPLEAAADSAGDGNQFSRYYFSRLDVHALRDGARARCENLRDGCPGTIAPDGRASADWGFLAYVNTKDEAPAAGTPAASLPPAQQAPAGSTGAAPGGTDPAGVSRLACRDTTPPTSRASRTGSRASRTGLRVRGTATDRGCGPERAGRLVQIGVSVARPVGTRCRFLRQNGTFGPATACARAIYLLANGTTSWSFARRTRLGRGRYTIQVRGVDAVGNVEKRSQSRNLLRLRVR
jgi:dienelactone hydrolase